MSTADVSTEVSVRARKPRKRPTGMVHDGHGRYDRMMPRDPLKDKEFLAFLGGIDRSELMAALEFAEDERLKDVLNVLRMPNMRQLALVTVFRKCGVTLKQAQEFWQNSKVREGMARLAKHLPKALEDTAIDAQSKEDLCERCSGWGFIVLNRPDDPPEGAKLPCPRCGGTGSMRLPGSKTARELVFEAAGLTGKGAPLVAIQQNFGEGLETLEQTALTVQKAIQKP